MLVCCGQCVTSALLSPLQCWLHHTHHNDTAAPINIDGHHDQGGRGVWEGVGCWHVWQQTWQCGQSSDPQQRRVLQIWGAEWACHHQHWDNRHHWHIHPRLVPCHHCRWFISYCKLWPGYSRMVSGGHRSGQHSSLSEPGSCYHCSTLTDKTGLCQVSSQQWKQWINWVILPPGHRAVPPTEVIQPIKPSPLWYSMFTHREILPGWFFMTQF